MAELVMGASLWTMTDENTGEIRTGVSVFYTDLDDAPRNDAKENGMFPIKISAPVDAWEEFVGKLPGVYNLNLKAQRKSSGPPTLRLLTGSTYIGPAPLQQFGKAVAQAVK